jgi:ABC-type multidrug transport system fused ATPase/permease subunit
MPTDQNRWILRGLNLVIKANETTTIVTETENVNFVIQALIMRLYDPEFGEILIDSNSIKLYDIVELRTKLSQVSL